jgi:hypothetical protein
MHSVARFRHNIARSAVGAHLHHREGRVTEDPIWLPSQAVFVTPLRNSNTHQVDKFDYYCTVVVMLHRNGMSDRLGREKGLSF